ncbi:MAG TPA: multidrug ABC transporter ATP-binding protein [Lachnospiraceae bacterium]|nr:multidrug ABC transporter ATP-binding protein [Lachnospiraceae bacterium]
MYLEIKNITKVIDGTKVLDSITLSMERGKIYGLRGRNGSGKTMIMKAVCGLIRVKEGEIWIDGELLGKKYDFPKSIGALIETPGFVENYSGYSNLKMLADMKGFIGKKEIEMIMERVGLDPKEKKKVKKYSLGMRQKLGIAAALMEHPELIVLDEPTNALDEESVQVLHCLLQEEKDRGALIMISSHDEEELKLLCDEIYIVNAGKVKKKLEQIPEGKQNNWEEVE